MLAPGAEFGMDDRNDKVIWASMPAQEPGKGYRGQDFVTVSGGTGFVLNPNTKNPAEASGPAQLHEQPGRAHRLPRAIVKPRRIRDDVRDLEQRLSAEDPGDRCCR